MATCKSLTLSAWGVCDFPQNPDWTCVGAKQHVICKANALSYATFYHITNSYTLCCACDESESVRQSMLCRTVRTVLSYYVHISRLIALLRICKSFPLGLFTPSVAITVLDITKKNLIKDIHGIKVVERSLDSWLMFCKECLCRVCLVQRRDQTSEVPTNRCDCFEMSVQILREGAARQESSRDPPVIE